MKNGGPAEDVEAALHGLADLNGGGMNPVGMVAAVTTVRRATVSVGGLAEPGGKRDSQGRRRNWVRWGNSLVRGLSVNRTVHVGADG
jgi:hypothetical protein